MKHIRTCFHTLLDPGLDFRVRLFNILAIGGMAVSLIMVFCSLFMGAWPNVCLNFLLALVSGGLFLYSYHSGHYQRCYLITIVLIFLIFFPVMFFTSGGYQGGMPLFFVFAVIFTILMLEKCLAILVSITEVLLYLSALPARLSASIVHHGVCHGSRPADRRTRGVSLGQHRLWNRALFSSKGIQ